MDRKFLSRRNINGITYHKIINIYDNSKKFHNYLVNANEENINKIIISYRNNKKTLV